MALTVSRAVKKDCFEIEHYNDEYGKLEALFLTKEELKAIENKAWAEYRAIGDKAWAEYDAILDKAYKEYEAKTEVPRAEYEAIEKKGWEEYNAKVANAMKEYRASHPELLCSNP